MQAGLQTPHICFIIIYCYFINIILLLFNIVIVIIILLYTFVCFLKFVPKKYQFYWLSHSNKIGKQWQHAIVASYSF